MSDPAKTLGDRVPMAGTIDAIGEAYGEDYARIRMPYRADLTDSGGTFHGGALATLLDVALCSAARPADGSDLMVVTLDLSLHFIASSNRDVIAEAEEHTSELQSRENLVCRLLLEKKKKRHAD